MKSVQICLNSIDKVNLLKMIFQNLTAILTWYPADM